MPEIGEIKSGREIGKCGRSNKYVWAACIDCGKERWVSLYYEQHKRQMCRSCSGKFVSSRRGEQNFHWGGGRRKIGAGYILRWISPDDFFYPMGDINGYVMEHRLVMAESLNRRLLPWEVVHHKNGKRDDNRLENLKLLPHRRFHIVDTLTKSYIKKLERENEKLRNKLKFITNSLNQTSLRKKGAHYPTTGGSLLLFIGLALLGFGNCLFPLA